MATDAKWARHSIGTAITALRYAQHGGHLPRREARNVELALSILTGEQAEQAS